MSEAIPLGSEDATVPYEAIVCVCFCVRVTVFTAQRFKVGIWKMASCTPLKENVLINYQMIPIRWSIRLCGEDLRGPAVSFEKRRKTYPHESFSASHTKEIFILPVRHQWMQFFCTNLRSECSCFKEMTGGGVAHKSVDRAVYSLHTATSIVDGVCGIGWSDPL